MPAADYNVYSLLVGKDRGEDRAGTTVVITVASRGITGPGRGFFSGEVSGVQNPNSFELQTPARR